MWGGAGGAGRDESQRGRYLESLAVWDTHKVVIALALVLREAVAVARARVRAARRREERDGGEGVEWVTQSKKHSVAILILIFVGNAKAHSPLCESPNDKEREDNWSQHFCHTKQIKRGLNEHKFILVNSTGTSSPAGPVHLALLHGCLVGFSLVIESLDSMPSVAGKDGRGRARGVPTCEVFSTRITITITAKCCCADFALRRRRAACNAT